MAIGSGAEIGVSFGVWKDMSEQQRLRWFRFMRENWQPNLMNGYATLVHNKNNRYYKEYK